MFKPTGALPPALWNRLRLQAPALAEQNSGPFRLKTSFAVKYWEIIADKSQQSRLEFGLGFSRGFQRANDLVCKALRGNGKRFVVHADEKLTAFVELESAIRACGNWLDKLA